MAGAEGMGLPQGAGDEELVVGWLRPAIYELKADALVIRQKGASSFMAENNLLSSWTYRTTYAQIELYQNITSVYGARVMSDDIRARQWIARVLREYGI